MGDKKQQNPAFELPSSAKKGQAAMEFLMTYGWAILVVLAAIGALAYFGVLSPANFLPNRCSLGAGFTCLEHKVNPNGTVQLRIQNNIGGDLSMANVTVVGRGSYSGCTPASQGFGTTINGDDIGGGVIGFDCGLTLSGKFSGTVTVTYTKSTDIITHTISGTITSAVES